MTDNIYYAKPQFLRKVFGEYMMCTGKNYFNDLYKAYEKLELTYRW